MLFEPSISNQGFSIDKLDYKNIGHQIAIIHKFEQWKSKQSFSDDPNSKRLKVKPYRREVEVYLKLLQFFF